jgi:hypothetical protein
MLKGRFQQPVLLYQNGSQSADQLADIQLGGDGDFESAMGIGEVRRDLWVGRVNIGFVFRELSFSLPTLLFFLVDKQTEHIASSE